METEKNFKDRALMVINIRKPHPRFNPDKVEFMVNRTLEKIAKIEAGQSPHGRPMDPQYRTLMLRLSTQELTNLLITANQNRYQLTNSESNPLFTKVKDTLIRVALPEPKPKPQTTLPAVGDGS